MLDGCSKNPLVPGSSPGGPPEKQTLIRHSMGIILSVIQSNAYALHSLLHSAIRCKSLKYIDF